ncbi:hypothetical protein AMS68_000592 [Peltaster fructicola]|uniref:Peroxin/Ferlin domain-containing protein n=1 Tax=Peltaster fructicola TaxID=286661 RepID=A0A6H0XKC4_9PEZI|nr:hypothetical protein AMS68_000592 [Peltaster fructicola]
MAAIDTDFMTDSQTDVAGLDGAVDGTAVAAVGSTYAAFSPDQTTATHRRTQASVLIHQKSPLLLATPPQVTRALAYSHPFLLPLNHLVGLLSWTTDDSWESFLLLSAFWFTVLYGDVINRFAGPLLLVTALIFGMYARKYSPLSRAARSDLKKKGEKALEKRGKQGQEEQDSRKSLDEILDTLQTFTNRCSVLIDPLLNMTEFLSTQTTATASTTRPALMSLFLRILLVSPVWTILSLPPLYIITTQRVVLVIGTFVLSFHSTPARVTRALLWRSRLVRALACMVTGLNFSSPAQLSSLRSLSARSMAKSKDQEKVRFTFTIYENQRRWLGLGWTSSLMSYERPSWTDSQLNPVAEPDSFVLPETDQEGTEWRWVDESYWHTESVGHDTDSKSHRDDDDEGWIYYDNSWQGGRATDGWGRYTRRRKWVRDAELIDLEQEAAQKAALTTEANGLSRPVAQPKRSWFARRRTASEQLKIGDKSDASSTGINIDVPRSRDDTDEDVLTPLRFRAKEWERDIGEGVVEGLG